MPESKEDRLDFDYYYLSQTPHLSLEEAIQMYEDMLKKPERIVELKRQLADPSSISASKITLFRVEDKVHADYKRRQRDEENAWWAWPSFLEEFVEDFGDFKIVFWVFVKTVKKRILGM